jgi:hypothetical protein
MDSLSSYRVNLLEKLGTPLLSAVSEAAMRARMQGQTPEGSNAQAERCAELLSRSTQLSLSMAKLMNIGDEGGEDGDAVRVALAALSGPVVANQYRMTGQVPGDDELATLEQAMRAVLSYGDKFSDTAQSAARLERIDHEFVPGDAAQMHIQYLQILVPVVNAVMAFPFGQDPKSLIGEVAERLVGRARQMRERLFPGLEGESSARAELGMLRTVANLYAQCHFAEMTRLMSMNEQQREGQSMSMDPLWDAFDERMAMVETLAAHIVPGTDSGDSGGAAPQEDVPQQPVQARPAQADKSAAGQTGADTPDAGDQGQQETHNQKDSQFGGEDDGNDSGDEGGFNPMAFFAKGNENNANDGEN